MKCKKCLKGDYRAYWSRNVGDIRYKYSKCTNCGDKKVFISLLLEEYKLLEMFKKNVEKMYRLSFGS